MKVKFFPKDSGIPVVKCNHRFGATITFSHQTDSRFQNSIYAAEMFGFRHNIRLGAFVSNLVPTYNADIDITEKTGLMRHDIYFATDNWKNPDTGAIEIIPDHYASAWTAAGAAYFDVNVGDPKTAHTPTCGKQMYDLTAGRLGFDTDTGDMGDTDLAEFEGLVDEQKGWLQAQVGRMPSSGSYRNGVRGESTIIYQSFIGVRNSATGAVLTGANADTWYGGSLGYKTGSDGLRVYFASYPSTTRWWDFWNNQGATKQQATDYVTAQFNATLANGGWYRDFCHFHSARNNGTLAAVGEFLGLISGLRGSEFVWTCSNGEALEYMYMRELASRVRAVERDGKVTIVVDVNDRFAGKLANFFPLNTPIEQMFVPLSVQVDLSGTSLAGKPVKSNFGKIINNGSNVYIVQVPFGQNIQFQSVTLEEGEDGYFNTDVPHGVASVAENKLTVTTDMPTRAVLYSVSAGGNDYDSLPDARINKLSTIHKFDITDGKDYRVGIISEFGQAALIE